MLSDAVARIVDAEDPEGLLGIGAPTDEYRPEVGALTALVGEGTVDEERVLAIWEHWFGPGSNLSRAPERLSRLTAALREVDRFRTDVMQLDHRGRPEPPLIAGEAATLAGFLHYQRATFAWRCEGLSDEQLRVTLPPSSMTLGGMLKHLAYVEDQWFTEVVAGAAAPEPWASVDWSADADWDWHSAADDTGDALRELWADRALRSRGILVAELERGESALGDAYVAWGGNGQVSLRWVLAHMIEEYARHNGHADLIRESIDGQTGE